MKVSKKIAVIPAIAGLIGSAGLTAKVLAETGTSDDSGPSISLVQRIANYFSLDKNEVQKVFDENKADRINDRQQKLETRLDQAVKDGKLTSEQKEKLLAKLKELQGQIKDDRVNDRKEHRQQMQQNRDELKQWAKDNGINLEEVLPEPDFKDGLDDREKSH